MDLSVAGAWATAETVPALLRPLRDNGWLNQATHFWVDDARPARLPKGAALDKLTRGWRDAIAEFFVGDRRDATWKLRIVMHRTGLYVTVAFARELLTPGLPDELAGLVDAWGRALSGSPLVLAYGVVTPFGVDHARPVPHRESRWQLGGIEYLLGRSWHGWDPETAAVLRDIDAATPPDGIVRSTAGDVTRLSVRCDVTDRVSLAEARARGERWFAPLVPCRLAPGWNAHGDRLAVIVRRDALAPFTFYDGHHRIGYKAVIVDPETGAVDAEVWQALTTIAQAKAAPDGTAVEGVRLIVPTRADAASLTDRARAAGIERVCYPEESAFWWLDDRAPTA